MLVLPFCYVDISVFVLQYLTLPRHKGVQATLVRRHSVSETVFADAVLQVIGEVDFSAYPATCALFNVIAPAVGAEQDVSFFVPLNVAVLNRERLAATVTDVNGFHASHFALQYLANLTGSP